MLNIKIHVFVHRRILTLNQFVEKSIEFTDRISLIVENENAFFDLS